jgi:hypothetical protein
MTFFPPLYLLIKNTYLPISVISFNVAQNLLMIKRLKWIKNKDVFLLLQTFDRNWKFMDHDWSFEEK